MNKKANNKDSAVRDRAKGALWGLLVGDALGDPLQFGPPRPDNHLLTEMEAGGPFRTPAGYWTDDGAMALCIIDSAVRKGGYDLRDIADTFLRWYQDGYMSSLDHAFDVGCSTSSSLHKYAATGNLVNGHEGAQGNGSLMRHAPATFLARKEGRAPAVCFEISDVTHASASVRECVRTLDAAISRHVFDHDLGKTDALGRYVKESDGRKVGAPRNKVACSGHAAEALDAALWAFHTTDTFEDALIRAVNNGNDSDTVGAITGQIAGSWYGFSAIPKRWLKAMKDYKKLDELIEKFLDIVLEE